MITECPHEMPSPASCFECMEDGPVAPPSSTQAPTLVATFTASFPGDCPGLPEEALAARPLGEVEAEVWDLIEQANRGDR